MIEIRRIKPDDDEALVALLTGVFPSSRPWNNATDMLRRKSQWGDDMVFVAEYEKRVVGVVVAGYDGVRGWIYSLAVDSEHRHLGAGHLLLEEAEAVLRQLGCPKINLQVRTANSEVLPFYKKCGYEIEDRLSLGKCLEPRENKTRESEAKQLEIRCRSASVDDAPALAEMNKRLIDDEGSSNPMSITEIQNRMENWITGDWQAVVFEAQGNPVGYILFQFQAVEHSPDLQQAYVRQFYVQREHRRQGNGARSFESVVRDHFASAHQIVLDVLETNMPGQRFWKSLGFERHSVTMYRKQAGAPQPPDGES